MDKQWLMYLPCAGEFLAVLQIEAAMLGRGRLSCRRAAALAMGLWMISQFLWGDYVPYSPWSLTFNGLRFAAASLLFGGSLLEKFFSVVVCGVTVLGYENVVTALAATFWGVRLADVWPMPFSILAYDVVLNLLVWLAVRGMKKFVVYIEPRQRLVADIYLCVAAAMNVLLAAFDRISDRYSFMLLLCVGLLLSAAVYFVLLTMFSGQTLRASQAQSRMEMEQERADALMESYQTQRRLTHEFTNHLDAINFYLEQQDIEGARAYLASVSQKVSAGTTVVNTHNPLMDALLSKEYHKAAEKGVMLHFDLCDLRGFPLRNTDLVTVMCNLLDNAIEAAVRADPPQVTLRIRRTREEYIVSVRNRVERDVDWPSGALPPTTKTESGHGMGLANVCSVLDRWSGEYTLSCRDRWFCFTFTLPNPAAEEEGRLRETAEKGGQRG